MRFVWCLSDALRKYWCKLLTEIFKWETLTISLLLPFQVVMILRQKGINPTIHLIDKIVLLSITKMNLLYCHYSGWCKCDWVMESSSWWIICIGFGLQPNPTRPKPCIPIHGSGKTDYTLRGNLNDHWFCRWLLRDFSVACKAQLSYLFCSVLWAAASWIACSVVPYGCCSTFAWGIMSISDHPSAISSLRAIRIPKTRLRQSRPHGGFSKKKAIGLFWLQIQLIIKYEG